MEPNKYMTLEGASQFCRQKRGTPDTECDYDTCWLHLAGVCSGCMPKLWKLDAVSVTDKDVGRKEEETCRSVPILCNILCKKVNEVFYIEDHLEVLHPCYINEAGFLRYQESDAPVPTDILSHAINHPEAVKEVFPFSEDEQEFVRALRALAGEEIVIERLKDGRLVWGSDATYDNHILPRTFFKAIPNGAQFSSWEILGEVDPDAE